MLREPLRVRNHRDRRTQHKASKLTELAHGIIKKVDDPVPGHSAPLAPAIPAPVVPVPSRLNPHGGRLGAGDVCEGWRRLARTDLDTLPSFQIYPCRAALAGSAQPRQSSSVSQSSGTPIA